jgi:protein gp37
VGKDSKVTWTHHTFNPWWGCSKVPDDPACNNCYAAAFAKRPGHNVWGTTAPRRLFEDKHWREPLKWDALAQTLGERHRVFCSSMADVFEARQDLDEHRERLWKLIDATRHLDWLLLTKRPQNIGPMLGVEKRDNVWLGTTAVTNRHVNDRLPELLRNQAAVHFLSAEPLQALLNPHSFLPHRFNREPHCEWCEDCIHDGPDRSCMETRPDQHGPFLDWVIAGGESGPRHRPLDLSWVTSLREQCQAAGVPIFVKQDSGPRPGMRGRISDEDWVQEFPEVPCAG